MIIMTILIITSIIIMIKNMIILMIIAMFKYFQGYNTATISSTGVGQAFM